MALYLSGMLLNQGYLLPDLINPDTYGIYIDAHAPDIATNNDVQVPNIQFHISEDVINTALNLILVSQDGYYGINHYTNVRDILAPYAV